MNELNFSLAEFPETVNHRGDTSDYERSIVRYLMNSGAEALAAIKAAGLNRNLLFTESAYQVMKACEVLDDQGRLPSEPCFPALNEHFLTLSRDELRNDTGKHETPLEAADLMAVAMEGMSHNQRMGERVLEDYVKAIIGAYHYKAKLQIAYAYFDALKKPGISIDRVTIETGNRMEALMQQVTQEGGATIDDATQDALTLHDYLQHELGSGNAMPSFGMPMLDEAFMLMPGSYTCLMGFPGSGKTTFAMQMANTTAASRLQVHFVSFEMSLALPGRLFFI